MHKRNQDTKTTLQCFTQLKLNNIPHQVIQILTGHCFLNSYQFRFKFSESQCGSCKQPEETVEHFMFECNVFSSLRTNFMLTSLSLTKSWPPSIPKIHKHPNLFIAMIKFVMSTKRLDRA